MFLSKGVPDAQLVKEGACVAKCHVERSVAEQNSVDLAWKLLIEEVYKDLCRTICGNSSEHKQFRQLVVNAVMATDIADKDLVSVTSFHPWTAWTIGAPSAPDQTQPCFLS